MSMWERGGGGGREGRERERDYKRLIEAINLHVVHIPQVHSHQTYLADCQEQYHLVLQKYKMTMKTTI